MKKKIAILGAFDRYNYGDLLFPIVIEEYLKKFKSNFINGYDINYYGLIESDLSIYGGKSTKGIEELFLNNVLTDGSIVIVAGGEVLTARWSLMYEYLSSNKVEYYLKKILKKLIGVRNYEKYIIKSYRFQNLFPWIVSKEDFHKNVKVFYNTVGGCMLRELNDVELIYIRRKLMNSDFLSVRDKTTLLNFNIPGVVLAPDSAIIISYFFDKSFLETKISKQIKDIIDYFKNGYVCFQINLFSAKGNEEIISKQLEQINKMYGYGIVLLPIGIAAGHEDYLALSNIKKRLIVSSILVKKINIYDIMYLISRSKAFIGTSLHGNITAISYSIPHIGINKNIMKLDSFLKTWDLEEQNESVNFEEIFNKFNRIININKNKLDKKRNELIQLVIDNFNNMFKDI